MLRTPKKEKRRKPSVLWMEVWKNRQSVVKNNSDDKAIVSETIYDYQGRPAIQVLPSPVEDPATCTDPNKSSGLKFYPKSTKMKVGKLMDQMILMWIMIPALPLQTQ